MAGRVVVVTGSTSGIGAAAARLFAADGEHVVIHGRNAGRGEALVAELSGLGAGGSARFIAADLADAGAADALVAFAAEGFGRVDVLVNNAGTDVFTGVMGSTLGDWQYALDTLLRAPWLASKAAAPLMPPGSAIVNVGSNHVIYTMPGCFPYNVAKAGLAALTQSLAIELAPRGIRANLVNPGYIDTPLNDLYLVGGPDAEAARARIARLHLTGRIGTADEVARAVRFLASSADSGFTTGATLLVDGGRSTLMEDPRP
jgi:NAD(P)-dependent dehydrogenase (short-subunit alcohol dehydrogenase family)